MNPVAPTALVAALQSIIPNVGLSCQGLPDTPIDLWLIPAELPTERMDDEVVRRIWQDTPYWVFCWASGLAMARWLLAEPELVRGKTVLDFGTGSGVVAIAARLAGAARVIACDIDPVSLAATRANAALNGVQLEYLNDLYALPEVVDVLLAADVLYEARDIEPVLAALDRMVAPDGLVWLAEPGREHAQTAIALAQTRGWDIASTLYAGPWPGSEDVVVRVHKMVKRSLAD